MKSLTEWHFRKLKMCINNVLTSTRSHDASWETLTTVEIVLRLYLNKSWSYDPKCVFDLNGGPGLELWPFVLKLCNFAGNILVITWYKNEEISMKVQFTDEWKLQQLWCTYKMSNKKRQLRHNHWSKCAKIWCVTCGD